MKGLLIAMGGKPKDDLSEGLPTTKAKGEESAGEETDEGVEGEFADAAFDAFQDGDREGFKSAFLSAVRACVSKSSAGDYETDDSEL